MYVKKHFDFLHMLCKCRNNRKHLLRGCNREQIYAICECSENVLRGRVKLGRQQKERLKRHKRTLVTLADPHIRWRQKKDILQRGSGVLTTLLSVAIPALVGLFAK